VPGDLDRLVSRHVLKLREFTLDGRRLRHDRLECDKSEYLIYADLPRSGRQDLRSCPAPIGG
jgi:hypothetical protein